MTIENLKNCNNMDPEGTTVMPPSEGEVEEYLDGVWVERDTGIESTRAAMQDFEALKQELTALSRTRSQRTEPSERSLDAPVEAFG